jgi:2'-5' RNA ligase
MVTAGLFRSMKNFMFRFPMRNCLMTAPISKRSVIVLWLVPAAAAREFLRETISRLAREWDGPLFEPHLTLGLAPALTHLPAEINARPIQLRPLGVFWSATFTKTLFIRILPTPELERLNDSLGIEARLHDPHLSLLYQEVSAEKKAFLASRLALPFSKIAFDAVRAVRCPTSISTRADVESWEAIASARLTGSS